MILSAIGYGRKSIGDPDRRTSSVESHHAGARAYAARSGLKLIGVFGEDRITGATMDRPGLKKLPAAAGSGVAKAIFIEDVDRLLRRTLDPFQPGDMT